MTGFKSMGLSIIDAYNKTGDHHQANMNATIVVFTTLFSWVDVHPKCDMNAKQNRHALVLMNVNSLMFFHPKTGPWNAHETQIPPIGHRQMPPRKAARKGQKKVVGQTLQVLEPCAKGRVVVKGGGQGILFISSWFCGEIWETLNLMLIDSPITIFLVSCPGNYYVF